ncbi:hypothetical protein RKD52_001316 [Metabacillus sp. SLBN-84]
MKLCRERGGEFFYLLTLRFSFFRFAGYDSILCLPSTTCFSELLGTIRSFPYPPPPAFRSCWVRFALFLTLHHLLFGVAGYDSLFCLPSTTRFSALLGTICSFAYPPPPVFPLCWVRFALLLTLHHLLFGVAGYDSLFCLPSTTCFSELLGTIRSFAYPPPPVFPLCWIRFAPLLTLQLLFSGFAGYDFTF